MFKNIEPFTKEKHQDLRYNVINKYDFAKTVSIAPISLKEFIVASKYYPIVFAKDNPLPMVFLSLANDNNYYLNEDGTWKVQYIPAYFRRYPFIFANMKKDSAELAKERFLLCIDRDAPHFHLPYGDLMFTANGEPTQLINRTIDFLKKYQEDLIVTENFVKLLEEKELLIDRHIQIIRKGQEFLIPGLRVVDIEKMNLLDDSFLAEWVRKGVISLIYAHTHSLKNFNI